MTTEPMQQAADAAVDAGAAANPLNAELEAARAEVAQLREDLVALTQ